MVYQVPQNGFLGEQNNQSLMETIQNQWNR